MFIWFGVRGLLSEVDVVIDRDSRSGMANFFVKGQIVNSLECTGRTIFVVTSQLCYVGMKAFIDNT